MHLSHRHQPIVRLQRALAQVVTLLRDLTVPLEPAVQPIYQRMLQRLQRDMLGLLLIVSLPLSIVFGVQLAHNTWATQTMPAAMFTIHLSRALVIYSLVPVLLWRGQMRGAWASLLTITLSTLLLQIWLIQEPGLLIFALFSMAGPALVLPLRVNALITALLIATLYLIAALTFPAYSSAWMPTALFFATIMLSLALIGVVVRRWLHQFAQMTITHQRAAVAQARLEQQASDLEQKVAELASLEHDLRQPLRAVQGYLAVMPPAAEPGDDLVTPALAAAGPPSGLSRTCSTRPTAKCVPMNCSVNRSISCICLRGWNTWPRAWPTTTPTHLCRCTSAAPAPCWYSSMSRRSSERY